MSFRMIFIGLIGLILCLSALIAWYLLLVIVTAIILYLYNICLDSCGYYAVNTANTYQYKDVKLINKCWEKAMDWNKNMDMFDQLTVGYCSYASMNCILANIFNQTVFLRCPNKPRPMSLNRMYETLINSVLNHPKVENMARNIGLAFRNLHWILM